METKQAVLPLSAPARTSILLCFGNRHNHITVFDETVFVSSMTLYQQAVSSYIQRPFLRCKMLVGKSQTLELHPMDAGCAFYKTLFQHTAGMRSHHGIVMITGIGIASQQANEPSRILILRANLAFVRTKALLATVMVLRMRLRNFSFALQTGWHFCIIGSMNARIKSEGLSD